MDNFKASESVGRLATVWLGRQVLITIDRPIGSSHPELPELIYSLNYGYIPGTLAGDGEPIDIYLIGESHPLTTAVVFVVAIIHRHNDDEDKLVGSYDPRPTTPGEVMQAVKFVEHWYDVTIQTQSGNVNYTRGQ